MSAAGRTILRVKRRRIEDPFHALVVQHSVEKKPRTQSLEEVDNAGKCIFKFAGTVNEGEDLNKKNFFEKLDAQKEFKTDTSIKDEDKYRTEKLFAQQCEAASPFKIISNSEMTSDDSLGNVVEIFDIENASRAPKKTTKSEQDPDAVICNSVQMIREKLKISDDSEIEDADYVYDLYYANERKLESHEDVLYIQTLDQDLLFDFEINGRFEDEDHIYGDDDDSNEESNWRNDYPDEDEFYNSDGSKNSDSEGENDSNSSSSLEEQHVFDDYRSSPARMKFDPYYAEDTESYNYEAYDDDNDDSVCDANNY
eukprot:gene17366-19104_t